MKRKIEIVAGEYYHVFNKSIEGFRIFNTKTDYNRMVDLIRYYQFKKVQRGFSKFVRLKDVKNTGLEHKLFSEHQPKEKLVHVIAYCLMPTHFHFVLKQIEEGGIITCLRKLQNSYACYFNTKYKRRGPLWTGRFKAVRVETQEQLLHLTRYVHLNPTTASLTQKPEDWKYSSYQEYINSSESRRIILESEKVTGMKPWGYRKFVEEHQDYQKKLGVIKKLLLEKDG